MARRQYQLHGSSPDKRRTALETFDVYTPFVLRPSDICWAGLVIHFLSKPDAATPTLLYTVLQISLRESQHVEPATWEDITKELYGPRTDNMDTLRIGEFIMFMNGLRDPDKLNTFMADDCQKVIAVITADTPIQPETGFTLLRRSWLGMYLRRCHLAYLKLSEAASYRLSKAFISWITVEGPRQEHEFSLDTVETPGYLIITTGVDERSHGHTDTYRSFKYEKHVGNVAGAVDNLRQYFDQQFTGGRQPPRQHALNAISHFYFSSGQIESARVMGSEAVDVARTVSDRQTLMNVSSMMRRLPPKQPPLFLNDPHQTHLRKVLLDREDAEASKSNTKTYGQYSLLQVGISPLDLLFDVSKGIDAVKSNGIWHLSSTYFVMFQGEPLSSLFRRRFEATGCLDLPQSFPGAPLETQWQIWAIDTQLWRMAGMSIVAEVGDRIILANTSPNEDIRLHTICNGARQLFQKGAYAQAFIVLLYRDNWARLSIVQYHYWSSEVWHLMWDIATRRGEERFKRDFLESRKPPPSPFAQREYGKKSAVSIRRLISEAIEASRVKNHTQATFLILDALHYAETNGYWYLYRSAIPIFADLELQRGKVESARRRIEEVLGQVARGEDLEQRAMAYAVYAKVKMAGDKSGDSLQDAIYYLERAELDYRTLEMYASVQDMLYLQAVVHEALGEEPARDGASQRLLEVEKIENEMQTKMDEGMVAIWDVVCEIGVAVASGDTFWEP